MNLAAISSRRWRKAPTPGRLQEMLWSRHSSETDARDQARRPMTVCFTGHRRIGREDAPQLIQRLDETLEALYSQGFRYFMNGGALGFDLLAAQRTLALRQRHADVRLIMVLPCGDQTLRWRKYDCQRYEAILYAADETRVLSPSYYEGCMLVRNRHMVDRSSLCLCYLTKPKGGTVSTVAYAMRQHVPVINLAMGTKAPPAGEK